MCTFDISIFPCGHNVYNVKHYCKQAKCKKSFVLKDSPEQDPGKSETSSQPSHGSHNSLGGDCPPPSTLHSQPLTAPNLPPSGPDASTDLLSPPYTPQNNTRERSPPPPNRHRLWTPTAEWESSTPTTSTKREKSPQAQSNTTTYHPAMISPPQQPKPFPRRSDYKKIKKYTRCRRALTRKHAVCDPTAACSKKECRLLKQCRRLEALGGLWTCCRCEERWADGSVANRTRRCQGLGSDGKRKCGHRVCEGCTEFVMPDVPVYNELVGEWI
ncbi:hypothetical protein QBC39DRAFT_413741 [Podospora conica]|nr:hypothetical protein QBC39DRAFT_413741 [Schizothecium conicum]